MQLLTKKPPRSTTTVQKKLVLQIKISSLLKKANEWEGCAGCSNLNTQQQQVAISKLNEWRLAKCSQSLKFIASPRINGLTVTNTQTRDHPSERIGVLSNYRPIQSPLQITEGRTTIGTPQAPCTLQAGVRKKRQSFKPLQCPCLGKRPWHQDIAKLLICSVTVYSYSPIHSD